jgi:hypothetical protein
MVQENLANLYDEIRLGEMRHPLDDNSYQGDTWALDEVHVSDEVLCYNKSKKSDMDVNISHYDLVPDVKSIEEDN